MKSKLAIFIAATALFVGVCFVRPVLAAVYDQYNTIIIYQISNGNYCVGLSSGSITLSGNTYAQFSAAIGNNFGNAQYASIADAINAINNNSLVRTGLSGANLPSNGLIICVKGTVINNSTNDKYYSSIEDYEESLQPTWWQKVWNAFTDFATSDTMNAVLSGDWLSYLDEVLFGELWTVKVGEGEDELVEFYTVSATPTPSPSPTPTQIPVSVNIDPSTGDVIYHYTVIVSGTPIPTSSPINPNPPIGSGGGGGDGGLSEPVGVEDYYEPDDSLSLPNLRIFQFKLNLPGTETDIGVDSLDNNFEVMNGYLEDNAEAITTVSSFFQVIPSEWFLLLGAIACFPIIAAMIKSLLGG